MTETKNLAAANEIGGKSSKPILIKIQVLPHTKHKIHQTIRGFIILKLIPFGYRLFHINYPGQEGFL